jgi:hypothetical protein
VKKENGEVVVIGWSYEAGGKHEYKMTMKILDDGTLEDRFFLKRDGQWSLGHLITYSITTDAEHIGAFD